MQKAHKYQLILVSSLKSLLQAVTKVLHFFQDRELQAVTRTFHFSEIRLAGSHQSPSLYSQPCLLQAVTTSFKSLLQAVTIASLSGLIDTYVGMFRRLIPSWLSGPAAAAPDGEDSNGNSSNGRIKKGSREGRKR